MAGPYQYSLTECDVADKQALQSFRDKRSLWLFWIDGDEHHAIWKVLASMVWTDVTFQTLASLATGHDDNALNNTLLAEALLDGHVATQVLAIRRLMDDSNTDIISLRRLVKDLKRNFHLFTRENYVCFDGLPYDFDAVQRREMLERTGKGFFWGATAGPEGHGTARTAHEQFDRLAGIAPERRSRGDRLPTSLLATLQRWLQECDAGDLAEWSHAYLAHAGGPESRKRIADLQVTSHKIIGAIKAMARVTEAISAYLLLASGRSSALMPVAQFNPFEKLEFSVVPADGEAAAHKTWHRLGDERNAYLDDVDDALTGGKR